MPTASPNERELELYRRLWRKLFLHPSWLKRVSCAIQAALVSIMVSVRKIQMPAAPTEEVRKISIWQRIADALAYMEQGSLERSDTRLVALELRVEALEREQRVR